MSVGRRELTAMRSAGWEIVVDSPWRRLGRLLFGRRGRRSR